MTLLFSSGDDIYVATRSSAIADFTNEGPVSNVNSSAGDSLSVVIENLADLSSDHVARQTYSRRQTASPFTTVQASKQSEHGLAGQSEAAKQPPGYTQASWHCA
jgi:hypothetical protein